MYGGHGPLVLLAVQERQAGKIIVRDSGFGIRGSGFGVRDSGFGVRRLLQMVNNSGRIIVE